MDAGERVRELRKNKGWTLKEVSIKTSLSVSYLSQIERGEKRLNEDTAKTIGELFSISPGLLLDEKIETGHLVEISEILEGLSSLSPEKLELVKSMIEALKQS